MKKSLLLALTAGWAALSLAQNMPLRETTPLPVGLQHFNSAQLPDGDVIVYGGTAAFPNPANATWRYDWETETWSQLANLAYPAAQMASTTLSNGNILCVGGTQNFSGKVQKSQLFDVNTLQWAESAGNFEFFNPIYAQHSVLTLPNDYVLLTTSNGNFSIYGPTAKTWSNQPPPAPLDAGGSPMVWLGAQQEVLFTGAGGQIFQPGNPPVSGNLFYLDPAQELYKAGVVKLPDGSVLTMNLEFNFNNTVTRYDPVTRTAAGVTSVPYNGGVSTRSAIVLPDGRVLTFGFGDITSPGNTKVVEVYDPVANSWATGAYSEMGPLGAPHLHLLPDSSVFAISPLPQQNMNKTWIINRDEAVASTETKQPTFRLLPNPASDWLRVEGLEEQQASLLLYRQDGALAGNWEIVEGSIFLAGENLSSGMYFYCLNSQDGRLLAAGKILFH